MGVEIWPLVAANLAVLAGALVQASIGYGMNLVAAPLLLAIGVQFVPGPLLVAHLLLVAIVVGFDWRHVDRQSLRWAVAASVPGAVCGAWALAWLPHLALALLTMLTLLVSVAAASGALRVRADPRNVAIAGFFSGFCGSATSINGPQLAAVMVDAKNVAVVRATLSAFLFLSTMLSIASLTAFGKFGAESVWLAATLVPGVLGGVALARLARGWIAKRNPKAIFLAATVAALVLFIGRETLTR